MNGNSLINLIVNLAKNFDHKKQKHCCINAIFQKLAGMSDEGKSKYIQSLFQSCLKQSDATRLDEFWVQEINEVLNFCGAVLNELDYHLPEVVIEKYVRGQIKDSGTRKLIQGHDCIACFRKQYSVMNSDELIRISRSRNKVTR